MSSNDATTNSNQQQTQFTFTYEEKDSKKTVRSRAAKSAVEEASTILAEQTKLQRQQSRVMYRIELFFALLSAGLAWNRLKQERDAVKYQLSNIRNSLENQLEPTAQQLFQVASSKPNTTTQDRQKRKETLYKWLEQAIFYKL